MAVPSQMLNPAQTSPQKVTDCEEVSILRADQFHLHFQGREGMSGSQGVTQGVQGLEERGRGGGNQALGTERWRRARCYGLPGGGCACRAAGLGLKEAEGRGHQAGEARAGARKELISQEGSMRVSAAKPRVLGCMQAS